MIERQELYCHDCEKYVRFEMDLALNGNHIVKCPSCGHEHCRFVENGRITDVRWRSSAQSFTITTATTADYSIDFVCKGTTSSTGSLWQLWGTA